MRIRFRHNGLQFYLRNSCLSKCRQKFIDPAAGKSMHDQYFILNHRMLILILVLILILILILAWFLALLLQIPYQLLFILIFFFKS